MNSMQGNRTPGPRQGRPRVYNRDHIYALLDAGCFSQAKIGRMVGGCSQAHIQRISTIRNADKGDHPVGVTENAVAAAVPATA
jgi:hypothetical protein